MKAGDERCEGCGRTGGIDHGAEHMRAVEFPESICEACWREAMARMSAAYRGETISLEDDGREEDDGR